MRALNDEPASPEACRSRGASARIWLTIVRIAHAAPVSHPERGGRARLAGVAVPTIKRYMRTGLLYGATRATTSSVALC